MARLSSYQTLCPLIDQENVLGVEADSTPDSAIVTLGKNIVIRYKLQDLKQINSWSTNDCLTTPVVYDETSKNYVAAFGDKNIRMWKEEDSNLNKIKKIKFNSSIRMILKHNGIPILVMQNGTIGSLPWAVENHKVWNSPGYLAANEKIISCQIICVKNEIYFCALTKIEQSYSYIVLPLDEENYLEDSSKMIKLELKRSSEDLVGHVVVQDNNNAYLLTLWSQGCLFSYPLFNTIMDPIPGTFISVMTAINTKHPVALVALNENTIAAYGTDANEEEAILVIYNIQFKSVQTVQKLKLFTNIAELWNIENKIVLTSDRHLAVVHYNILPQRIEAMLGSELNLKNNSRNQNKKEVLREYTAADWGLSVEEKAEHKIPLNKLNKKIATQVSACLDEGMSNAAIHEKLIPQLIESKDISSILWCLDHLKDLSEELLIDLLNFCLKISQNKALLQNGNSVNEETKDSSPNELLDKILSICYTDVSLISYLRARLNFDQVLNLLEYVINRLNDNSTESDSFENSFQLTSQLYEWIKLLIDAHYQRYILSRDEQVVELLDKLNELLEMHFQEVNETQILRSMIQRVMNGKPPKCIPRDFNKFYSVEEVKLY